MMAFKAIAVLVCVAVCKSELYHFEGGKHLYASADNKRTDSTSPDHGFEESKLKSFILQLFKHDSPAKKRHIRATRDDFADILMNDPELQASIKAIFGSPDNPAEQLNQTTVTQSVDPSLQNDPELRAIIDKTLEPAIETKKEEKDGKHSSDPSDLNYSQVQPMKSQVSKRNTSEPLNEMIYNFFGPEVKTPMTDQEAGENVNEHNISMTSENDGGDGVTSIPGSVQTVNETLTSDGSKKGASHATKSSVLVYIVTCLILFLIL